MARLRVGDAHAWYGEDPLGIEGGVALAHLQGRVGDEAQTPPFEVRPELHDLVDDLQRLGVAVPGHHPAVLVLHLRPLLAQLLQEHVDRGENVEWFEAGAHQRLAVVPGDEVVGPAADDGGDVAGADEAVETQVGRVEDGLDGGDDRHVVAEDREVLEPLSLGPQHRHRR